MTINDAYLWERANSAVAFGPQDVFDAMRDATILVTGSTGLVCSQLVRILLSANDCFGIGVKLLLPVRTPEKVRTLFGDRDDVSVFRWSLGESLEGIPRADYVVHAATTTASHDFRFHPVEVIEGIVSGAKEALDFSLRSGSKKCVLLSSMEVYGEAEGLATEDNLGKLDPMVVRNSYPEAKRLSECLAASYADEYGVNASIIRLAQTFGEGAKYDDARVFAEFARCAIEGRDIVLLTDGSKRNPYLSVQDASYAILTVLVRGEKGVAYNAANEATYCSIREMADLVARKFGQGRVRVRVEPDAKKAALFRKSSTLELDTSRLRALGWAPRESLEDMYKAMMGAWGDDPQH